MMYLNNSFNLKTFLNTHPPFVNERFDIWKSRMKIFTEANKFELWNIVINDSFTPTYYVNNKLLNKLNIF